MEKEIRNFDVDIRFEERADKQPMIIGHAAVFESRSENLGGFTEVIQKGAFDNVLNDDVRALFNHDSNLILGRTKSKTLKLSIDDKGLRSDIDPPNTTYANDLAESMRRGDVSQMSFGFSVDEDKWEEDQEGRIIRTIMKVKRLYDVSPVTFPAYPETDVALRGLEDFKKTRSLESDEVEKNKREQNELIEKLELDKDRKTKLLNLIS